MLHPRHLGSTDLLEVLAEVSPGRLIVFHVTPERPKIIHAARRAP
jgi:hypothetical protein